MLVIRSLRELQAYRDKVKSGSVGFVPTMGDLHEGHLSLLRRAKKENAVVFLSIFVNPAQFNSREDFEKYRRDEKGDLEKAEAEKADAVFIPSAEEMYPEGYQTKVSVPKVAKNLCGAFRPGHFDGVATVVLKLFNLVRPHRAYFGLKDYQQFKLIERMAADLNLPIELAGCPTVREPDGLAMSSRNSRLSPPERARAARIYSSLQAMALLIKSKPKMKPATLLTDFKKSLKPEKGDKIEYLAMAHPDTLALYKTSQTPCLLAAAVWVGKTRLIDNLLVR